MDSLALPALATLYLAVAAAAGALLLFPAVRLRLATAFGAFVQAMGSAVLRASTCVAGGVAAQRARTGDGARRIGAWTWRHRLALSVAALVMMAPALAALALRRHHVLEGFGDSTLERNSVVGWLLLGEQLVPPPPLPPEVFTTREVEEVRPALASASRDWMVLDADLRQRLLRVSKAMEAQGYAMALLEGYRSPERQTLLASLGTHVTSAGAYQSYHQFGLAADCAFLRDGKLVISEKDPWAMRGYQLYGATAEAAGLTWGGRWQMMDFGHIELRRPDVLKQRR